MKCPRRSEASLRFPGNGVMVVVSYPVGAEKWTHVLCKSAGAAHPLNWEIYLAPIVILLMRAVWWWSEMKSHCSWIWDSLMAKNVEYFFIYLFTMFISPFESCAFLTLTDWMFSFWVLYVFEMLTLCQMCTGRDCLLLCEISLYSIAVFVF